MRLAHLADTHLGFRQYEAHTPQGGNQREADVALAFTRAMDGVISAAPDAVVLAGDVFHSVRPPNSAILHAFVQLGRLRAALPNAPVLMIAGDHDTPRSSDAATIHALYRALGVTVVERGIELVSWPGLKVLAVPKLSARHLREYTGERGDVLVLHGEARHLPGADVEAEALTGWRYVALGHWHVCQQVGPQAWYSGSLDYTSTDPWSELRAEEGRGKGWLLADTETGAVQWQPIEPPRRFLDLGHLDATDAGAVTLNAMLAATLEPAPLDGAVARVVVDHCPRALQHELDQSKLRAQKARALQLNVVFNRPERVEPTLGGVPLPKRLPRLEDLVAAYLGDRALPPDVEREELQKLAVEYLTKQPDPYTGEADG